MQSWSLLSCKGMRERVGPRLRERASPRGEEAGFTQPMLFGAWLYRCFDGVKRQLKLVVKINCQLPFYTINQNINEPFNLTCTTGGFIDINTKSKLS